MSLTNGLTKRGALIVFEGCDRCGKSTQSSMLVAYLNKQNVPVKHMAFPNRTSPSGGLINAYLTNKQDMPDECIHLMFSVNRWEAQNDMKKLLNNGTTLVVDRYSYSGVAYTSAKGLSFDWCQSPERGLIRPDLVLYLKSDVGKLTTRSDFGTERYEKKEFQEKVAKVFDEIYKSETSYWTRINAVQDADSIHEIVASETTKVIEKVEQTPMQFLWK